MATESAKMFKAWLETFPDGANILVIHHSPAIELIAYGLLGVTIPQLQPCQGIRITQDNDWRLTTLVDDPSLDARA